VGDAGSEPDQAAPLRGPFANASPEGRRRLLWVAGVCALALWLFLAIQDRKISDTPGPGIIPFEVAGTQEHAREILDDWGPEGQDAARVSLIADYPYLVVYSIFLAVGCTIAAQRLGRRGMQRLSRIGPPLGWAQFVAGAFDAIEDAALLRVLDGHTEAYPGIAFVAAVGKFALAGLGVAYVILGAVLGRAAKAPVPRRKPEPEPEPEAQ
jgi:hypothetical protein